jgi:lysophospholipase L1-like esterase
MRTTWQSSLGAITLACATTTPVTPPGCQIQSPPETPRAITEAPAPPTGREGAAAWLDDRDGRALEPFYRALRDLETQRATGPLRVVQLGDSHTQDGSLVRRVRARLQARFGDGGPGFMLPGAVARYGLDDEPTRRESPEESWTIAPGLRRGETGPFGLGLVRVTSARPGATVTFGPWRAHPLDTASVEVFHEVRENSMLEYRFDEGPWARVPDDGVIQGAAPVRRLALRSRGTVDLYGVAVETGAPGVVVDGAGVVGAHAAQLAAIDWTSLGRQLTRRAPRLVAIQFGTNEVASHHTRAAVIEATFAELIARVKRHAPESAVLVFGPPDMARREGETWVTPAGLADVIAAERRAAERAGAAFFDSLAALGGAGRMDELTRARPALAYPDHIHLTRRGYEQLADAYVDALTAGYTRWRSTHPD